MRTGEAPDNAPTVTTLAAALPLAPLARPPFRRYSPRPVKLSALEGQPRAVALLGAALARDRVHHAWLLAGPPGVGKETAARAFAASLLCTARAPGATDACGGCDACRKAARGVHPDLLQVLPEAEAVARGLLAREDLSGSPSRELKVEQIRRLEAALSIPPLEGGFRPVILAGADGLNAAAQNAFLKTLEEPPQGTVILLVADAADRLLPTIRSRCVRVPFVPLPLPLVAAKVRAASGVDEATAHVIAALAGGSLGEALALDAKALAGRAERLAEIEALGPADLRPALRLAERLAAAGRDEAASALAELALFYRDVAAACDGVADDAFAHRDLAAAIRAAAARGAPEALRRARLASRARDAVLRQAAPRLVLERLFLSLALPEAA